MQFDDRLATVLRMQAGNERLANTQYRQLLDLAGTAPEEADDELLARAYARLEELSAKIDAARRGEMIREPGMRLRNPALIAFLAWQEMPVVSAAMAVARLNESQWDALIPDLPIPARALLRHRRNLPGATSALLARLGVADLVLPRPAGDEEQGQAWPGEPETVFDIDPDLAIGADGDDGIGALVRRIEAFQRARETATAAMRTDAPLLPLVEPHEDAAWLAGSAFDFETDTKGRIIWADPAFAPMAVGLMLANQGPDAPAQLGTRAVADFINRQPIEGVRITIDGAPAIAGAWKLDAAPRFAVPSGSFTGYRGRLRRPAQLTSAPAPSAPSDTSAERMRQVLHELRTPVNAIQGFAEIIQQQLFGPTPNEYRALAASIAGDAARMLAGFDEIDRLARLESGVLELESGACDFHEIVAATAGQLEGVLRQRTAGFDLSLSDAARRVALAPGEAEMLAWRIMATLAGAATPGEALQIRLTPEARKLKLTADLPAALAERGDVFASAAPAQTQSVSAGMFGAGFTLRLARAEARAAGGDLAQGSETLTLRLPLSLGTMGDSGANDVDLGSPMADTA